MQKADWRKTWDPKKHWKDTEDFLTYRDELAERVMRLVAEWKNQRSKASKLTRNLPYFCERLEKVVKDCAADPSLPEPTNADIETLADELGDYLSVLPHTDCWSRHPGAATKGEPTPTVCSGCPFVGPIQGVSGEELYYGCDVLAFFGQKLVEWRVGLPTNPWPEPGVWTSAFETNRARH